MSEEETNRPQKTAGSGWFNQLKGLLFGFDYFISYSHEGDGHRLAKSLQEMLAARDYSCFRDETNIHAGTTLGPFIRSAIRRTKVLLVVGTKHAPNSKWVHDEITLFSEPRWRLFGKRRTIVPVDFAGIRESTPFPKLKDTLWICCDSEGPDSETIDKINNSFEGIRANQRGRIVLGIMGLLAIVAATVFWFQKEEIARQKEAITEQRDNINNEEQRVRSELMATRARTLAPGVAGEAFALASEAYELVPGDLSWAAWVQLTISSRPSWWFKESDQIGGKYQLKMEDGQMRWISNEPDSSEGRRNPAPAIAVDDYEPEEADFHPSPQGGSTPYVVNITMSLEIKADGESHDCQILADGDVIRKFVTKNPPGFGIVSNLDRLWPRRISSVQWWDLDNLRKRGDANEPLEAIESFTVERPDSLRAATLAIGRKFWWIDGRLQLRQATTGSRSIQISDETYGDVLDFSLSPDGAWVAIKHETGVRIMDARNGTSGYNFEVEGAAKAAFLPEDHIPRIVAYCEDRESRTASIRMLEPLEGPRSHPITKDLKVRSWPSVNGGLGQYPLVVLPERVDGGESDIVYGTHPSLHVFGSGEQINPNIEEPLYTSRRAIKGLASSKLSRSIAWIHGAEVFCGRVGLPEADGRKSPFSERSINLGDDLQHVEFSSVNAASLWASSNKLVFKLDLGKNKFGEEFRVDTPSSGIVPVPREDSLIVFDRAGTVKLIDETGKTTRLGSLQEPATAIAPHPTQEVLFVGNRFGDLSLRRSSDLIELGLITLAGPIQQISVSESGNRLLAVHGGKISAWAIGIDDLKENAKNRIARERQ
jgi:hypothetical protein